MREIYFDNAATTKPCKEAVEETARAMTLCYGNPSSGYRLGREAARTLRECRETIAGAMGAKPGEIYFTSGGTEGDNWAVRSSVNLRRHRGKHIVTSETEHDAVLNTVRALEGQGWSAARVAPDKSGAVSVSSVVDALREDTVLVTVMHVNNETGAVNPVREISDAVKAYNSDIIVHTDAVQSFMKLRFTPKDLGADLVTVSSHKVHGPKGCGALYIREGLRLPAFITGGGQEGGLRSGTEAMPAVCGFAAAVRAAAEGFDRDTAFMAELKNYILERLKSEVPKLAVIGESGAPHIINISLPGCRSEVVMNALDGEGIFISNGSACKKGARSHVIDAMRLPPDVAAGALRISLSRFTTKEEADILIESLRSAASRLRTKK